MSAGVVGDEVGFELLLGDGVDVAGHPAAVHHDLQVAEPSAAAVD